MRSPLKSLCDVFWRLEPRLLSKFYFKPVLIPSSSFATRSLSFLGCWQRSAGTSDCASSPHLSAGDSRLPQALLPAMPQLLQLTVLHLSSKAPPAVAKLTHWAFSQSSKGAGTCSFVELLYGSEQQKMQPLTYLGLCSSKRDVSFSFKELAVVPNSSHKILENSEAFHGQQWQRQKSIIICMIKCF